MEHARSVLVSGLGGGLDIVNATLVFYALRNEARCVLPLFFFSALAHELEGFLLDLAPCATLRCRTSAIIKPSQVRYHAQNEPMINSFYRQRHRAF